MTKYWRQNLRAEMRLDKSEMLVALVLMLAITLLPYPVILIQETKRALRKCLCTGSQNSRE